jgi:predicted permease
MPSGGETLAGFSAMVLHSLRLLRKSPLYTGVAVASLALGLGANTAIFSLLDQVLFRPLPVKNPHDLVVLKSPDTISGFYSGDSSIRLFSYPMYKDMRDRNQAFDGLIARYPVGANFAYQAPAEDVAAELVTGNFFDVLGVVPARGRLLTQQDDVTRGAHPVAVLSYGFWTRRFGGNPAIVGQTVRVNSTPMTVIGITPREFYGVDISRAPDVYVPLMMKTQMTPTWDRLDDRNAHWLSILGRVRHGLSQTQAAAAIQVTYKPLIEAELASVRGDISPARRERDRNGKLILLPGYNGVPTFREQASGTLLVLMGMVGLVLLVACANVANLTAARGFGRQREIAVRLALGARRSHLVRELLTESVMLSIFGAAGGLVLADWTAALITAQIPGDPGGLTRGVDARMFVFAFGLSILTGVVFGLLPALQATRPDVQGVLKDQAANILGGSGHLRSRRILVIAQVALSLLLLVGSGLFSRSLRNLQRIDPGFRIDHLALFTMDASRLGYGQPRVLQLYDTIQQRLKEMPGVEAAALGSVMPLNGDQNISSVNVQGHPAGPDEDTASRREEVSPEFFASMRIPLLRGRDFTAQDRQGAAKVAVVNETFVRNFFAGGDPIGKRFSFGQAAPDIEIIGVAKDAKYDNLHNENVRQVYIPYAQAERLSTMTARVQTALPPETIMPALRREMAQIDPDLSLSNLISMEGQVRASLFEERMVAILCAAFSALATILASVGLYGAVAFSVARRTHEIGIRMALGAERKRILRMVLKEVAWMCVIGVGVGLPAAVALARLIQSNLYGVRPMDPVTLAGSVGLMLFVSLAAGFLPARRAATVDPMEALHYQ